MYGIPDWFSREKVKDWATIDSLFSLLWLISVVKSCPMFGKQTVDKLPCFHPSDFDHRPRCKNDLIWILKWNGDEMGWWEGKRKEACQIERKEIEVEIKVKPYQRKETKSGK